MPKLSQPNTSMFTCPTVTHLIYITVLFFKEWQVGANCVTFTPFPVCGLTGNANMGTFEKTMVDVTEDLSMSHSQREILNLQKLDIRITTMASTSRHVTLPLGGNVGLLILHYVTTHFLLHI